MQVVFLPVNNTGKFFIRKERHQGIVYFEGEKKDFWKLKTENQTLNSKPCRPNVLDKMKTKFPEL